MRNLTLSYQCVSLRIGGSPDAQVCPVPDFDQSGSACYLRRVGASIVAIAMARIETSYYTNCTSSLKGHPRQTVV